MSGSLFDNLFTLELINAFSGGGGPGTLTGGATANIITSFTAEHDGTWSLTIGGSGFFTQANGDMANALARVQLDLAEDGVLIYPSMMGFGQSWSDSGGPTPAPSGINTGTPLVAGSYFGDVVAGKTYALSVTAHATFSLLGSQAFAQADASGIVFGVAYDEGILASTSPPAETPVPEPAFLGLTALAVPLVLRRRR